MHLNFLSILVLFLSFSLLGLHSVCFLLILMIFQRAHLEILRCNVLSEIYHFLQHKLQISVKFSLTDIPKHFYFQFHQLIPVNKKISCFLMTMCTTVICYDQLFYSVLIIHQNKAIVLLFLLIQSVLDKESANQHSQNTRSLVFTN